MFSAINSIAGGASSLRVQPKVCGSRHLFSACRSGAAALLAFQLLMFWPVAGWYARRLTDGSDEPYGIAAAASLLVLAVTMREKRNTLQQSNQLNLCLPVLFTLFYALSYPFLPPLGRAGLAALSLASTVGIVTFGIPYHLGIIGLALLSLPLIPTVQFYLGYPLRLINAQAAGHLLSILGFNAIPSGTLLNWDGKLIWFDAPCSGTHMLWGGSFLHCILAVLSRASRRQTVAIGLAVSLLVLIGNIARTVILFFPEAGIVPNPAGLHNLIGLLVFGIVAAAVVGLHSLGRPESAPKRRSGRAAGPSRRSFLAVHLAAGLLPLLISTPPGDAAAAAALPQWPSSVDGLALKELPLTDREAGFLRDFPGKIARFSTPQGEMLLRYVSKPTRKLHPAADCLRGSGFAVRPAEAQADLTADGAADSARPYSCSIAERGAQRLKVCEKITDRNGNSFGDVSEWYWATLLGKTDGPWLAVTTSSLQPE